LLVEDHERFAVFVKEGLEKGGFTVDAVNCAGDGDAAMGTVDYDAVVLDLGLPDQDGLDILKKWREDGDVTPVLILTARDAVEDRVKGLNAGADDYMLKPFAMEELVARVRALLRRPGGVLGTVLQEGNIEFDTTAREVRINEKTVSISRREMEVLEQLLRRKGRVCRKMCSKIKFTVSMRKYHQIRLKCMYRDCVNALSVPALTSACTQSAGLGTFYQERMVHH